MAKKRRKPRPSRWPRRDRRSLANLRQVFEKVERLIERDQPHEALEILNPLLEEHPHVADLHYYFGYAQIGLGNIWEGLESYERALELSRDPGYWLPLASLYLRLELNVHALKAFRQAIKHRFVDPTMGEVYELVSSLAEEVEQAAHSLGISVSEAEKGFLHLEEGQRALRRRDFSACIVANRQAIKLLGDWPPPHNNLSAALFYTGQPQKAIEVARQVLSWDPDNVQALGNAIRFLAWTGQEAEALALWARLKAIEPQNHDQRLKMAEAAAVLDQDESVYQLLEPLAGLGIESEEFVVSAQVQLFLAIAEANLGKRAAARHRLRALSGGGPWIGELVEGLEAGRPGPGWADRYPYFSSAELLPRERLEEFVGLVGQEQDMPADEFRAQIERFVASFPQILRLGEKLIWEERQPAAGSAILEKVATPAAYAALRRFGLSQAGDDDPRVQTLLSLVRAGEIEPDETLQVWFQGEWREMQLRGYEISDEFEWAYTPQVAELIDQALETFQRNDDEGAERLFRRALELEPRAKEAYNNLGTICARRGDDEQAKEMFRAAIEIDPLYVFPRCNLATYLLDEDDLEGAEAMLEPLVDRSHFRPQEMAFYSYTQARILVEKREYDRARRALQMALEIWPDYEAAQRLLDQLEEYLPFMTGFDSIFERQRKRDRAWRARLQAQLSTPDPSLHGALSLYTKEALTGMAREVVLWGGWSALRKAELLERIVEALQDPDTLARIVHGLEDEEREALRQVLARGGSMPWQEFDARYGNDLDESRYWQWHTPETSMGRLRLRGLLIEATVAGELLIVVPTDLRPTLHEVLN